MALQCLNQKQLEKEHHSSTVLELVSLVKQSNLKRCFLNDVTLCEVYLLHTKIQYTGYLS